MEAKVIQFQRRRKTVHERHFLIEIKGLHKLNGYLRGLPRRLRNELRREAESFMLDVKKSAKLMAPRDTGELASSIVVDEVGRNSWVLRVLARHGVFQEEGFAPHWVHSDLIGNSNKLLGTGFFFVSKSKPFVAPALENNLSRLSQRLSKATQRALRRR
jgi:hypothetical protein